MTETYISHVGVLGMHWGRRKNSESPGSKSFSSQKVSAINKEKVKKGALIAAGVVTSIGVVGLAYYVGKSSASKNLAKMISPSARKVGKAAVAVKKLGNKAKTLPPSMKLLDITFEEAMRYTGRIY